MGAWQHKNFQHPYASTHCAHSRSHAGVRTRILFPCCERSPAGTHAHTCARMTLHGKWRRKEKLARACACTLHLEVLSWAGCSTFISSFMTSATSVFFPEKKSHTRVFSGGENFCDFLSNLFFKWDLLVFFFHLKVVQVLVEPF
jgi:hypothetical protein